MDLTFEITGKIKELGAGKCTMVKLVNSTKPDSVSSVQAVYSAVLPAFLIFSFFSRLWDLLCSTFELLNGQLLWKGSIH